MDLYLTEDEQIELENISERYQYALLLWNLAMPVSPGRFEIDAADAWEWKDTVDLERKGFLPLAKGSLRQKLKDLYDRIA